MQEILKKLRDNLIPIYGKNETEAIIRIIFHYLKGWDLTQMLIHSQEELSPFIKDEIDKILTRLLNHEPIQYITGEARFHGLELSVTPAVLIPRPETAEMVDLIIDCYKGKEDLRILDLCTGSGCIAIALARSLPFSKIDALDISSEALEVARINASKLKVKINFIEADVLKFRTDTRYDIIVSNPPYVTQSEVATMDKNVVLYEPHQALFVPDNDPLLFYAGIAEIAAESLLPGGRLFLEVNPRFVSQLKQLLGEKGFMDTECIKDSFGKDRFIISKWNA